ncbi:LPS-assembly protein LptD [Mesorhizobium australicum]|uniref:LPS-assembly protein LptD n=1 Tax=Mesorhizobium australicum TaxID=536018 RepID=A0A1X7P0E3_9HYPH|nr:LPS-assembly protein [Mesorhizobium australicum]
MGVKRGSGSILARAARLSGATAIACVLSLAVIPANLALSQTAESLVPQPSGNEQMLLEADTLIYDNDQQRVTAAGSVQIEYSGNRIVAQRVTYDRKTGRVIASGNVELVDRQGTKIYSDEVDITEDFRDGFVNALRVETADKTYFAAESAERRNGILTTFNNGVYTACEPCEEKPGKPPIWRVKAQRIIWNGEAKTVRFERAKFELFGLPIAYVPYFTIPDPTVKRKSGFLIPGIGYESELGASLTVPYYLALSPTYDALFKGTYYGRQGFLGDVQWRQQFNNGQYEVRIAGIHQRNPDAFTKNTVDSSETNRGMIGTKGQFKINPRWTFGWDVMVQSDKNFSRTYEIEGYDKIVRRNEVYLTGLNDRNYFDLRLMKFNVQENTLDDNPANGVPNSLARDPKQPWVLPSLDYTKTVENVAGGQIRFDMNVTGISRDREDLTVPRSLPAALRPPGARVGDSYRMSGIEGETGRVTAEAEWKREIVTGNGFIVTPLLSVRGDGIYSNPSAASVAAVNAMAGDLNGLQYSHDPALAYSGVEVDIRSSYFRPMATAGLEFRWPWLFAGANSSHVFEPMAQIFVRPNEAYGSTLDIPNEDAQSFVFDAASLFERDKFSGYDRVEGGTRANLGVRYTGSFWSGWGATGIFGQSYHLAGDNPFASPDLVNVGAYSGLETDTSDFVALFGVTSPTGFSISASGRFDEQTFETRRAELKTGFTIGQLTTSTRFAYIQKQPLYGFAEDRQELTVSGKFDFNENWAAFASGTHDFVQSRLVRNSIGFQYDDECFTYSMTFTQVRPTDQKESLSVGFNIAFRTIGDFGSSSNALDQ